MKLEEGVGGEAFALSSLSPEGTDRPSPLAQSPSKSPVWLPWAGASYAGRPPTFSLSPRRRERCQRNEGERKEKRGVISGTIPGEKGKEKDLL